MSIKQIEKNSDEKQGFSITNGKPDNLYLFESSIDLLSYASMYNPANARMMSTAGLKPQTYYNSVGQIYEETRQLPKNVVFAVDSDESGEGILLEHINNKLEHRETGTTVKIMSHHPKIKTLNSWEHPKI